MKDILQEIMAHKVQEVAARKQLIPAQQLIAEYEQQVSANTLRTPYSFSQALRSSDSGIISEFKRKSPSKGWIFRDADPAVVTPAYEKGGATALSILTDGNYFGGSEKDLRTARSLVQIPILRKDFICDAYQLYEARLWGADAVLLIAAALTKDECRTLARKAHELNLEVLLEIHSAAELEYLNDCVDVVGINNRNLGTFHTDTTHSFDLAEQLPKQMVRISESGISDAATARKLRQQGFNGFLIGEYFMRTGHPGEAVRQFIQEMQS